MVDHAFHAQIRPGKWGSSRQMVKEVQEDKVEVFWLVEVAGMARIV
jgi:hypothetical protein